MSQRTDQVESLIRTELGTIFTRDLEFPEGVLATVMDIECPLDLAHAIVWVAVNPADRSDEVITFLRSSSYEIQRQINSRLAMKIIPKLIFRADMTEEQAEDIDRLLDSLKK